MPVFGLDIRETRRDSLSATALPLPLRALWPVAPVVKVRGVEVDRAHGRWQMRADEYTYGHGD